jgi:hypothetical protein
MSNGSWLVSASAQRASTLSSISGGRLDRLSHAADVSSSLDSPKYSHQRRLNQKGLPSASAIQHSAGRLFAS